MQTSATLLACLLRAWQQHERELRHWLLRQLPAGEVAEDALQDIFIKAMTQGARFCAIEQPRAWLFEVARHHLIDQFRKRREWVPLPESLSQDEPELAVVDELSGCLPRVLAELSVADRQILMACDIHGLSQQRFATQHGLSLSATKSRLQRARIRLKAQLTHSCAVKLDADGKVCGYTPRAPLSDDER